MRCWRISTGQIDLAITGLAFYTPARAQSMELSIGYNMDKIRSERTRAC
ncbi:MAG: hypothetical protein ACLVJ6_00735 [Merdibacter sp.]